MHCHLQNRDQSISILAYLQILLIFWWYYCMYACYVEGQIPNWAMCDAVLKLFAICRLSLSLLTTDWAFGGNRNNSAMTNVPLNLWDCHIRHLWAPSLFQLLEFQIKILRLESPSPSNGETVNEILPQRCDVRWRWKKTHQSRTTTKSPRYTCPVWGGNSEKPTCVGTEHMFWKVWVQYGLDGFGENQTFLQCQSFRSAWQE